MKKEVLSGWRNWQTRPPELALVAEPVYAQRLGRCPVRVRGSNPLEGTKHRRTR